MELRYEKRDGYSILTGYSGTEEHIEIASRYEGLPVMKLAPNVFVDHEELLTVTLPMSIQKIGDSCFRNCKNLICVCIADEAGEHSVFPPALYYVGDRAFEGTALKNITFTSPYVELGAKVFRESAIADVCFRDSIKVKLNEGVFAYCQELKDNE